MANFTKMSGNRFFVFILLFFLPSFVYISSAEEDYVPDELIVGYKESVDPGSSGFRETIGWRPVKRTFRELNMSVIKTWSGESVEDVQRSLENNPNVEYVEKNYIVYANVIPNDPSYFRQGYLGVIDAPQAWDIQTGSSSTVIAVLDTGVEGEHADISGKVLPGCNVLGGATENSCNPNTDDNNGHGTGVAGTATAQTNNSTGVAGVCWNCLILPVKVLGDNGSGSNSDVIEGILFARNYALNNPTKKVIANMSLGRDCNFSGPGIAEQQAIDLAWNSGVLIVVAAGNSGNSRLQCPAAANNVMAVSATTNSDNLASFSSYGSFVDLAAPGVNIYNAFGTSDVPGSFYTYWSGTSFSSPVVAGVAGLVWSVDPGLTNGEVDQILRDTAENIGSSFFFGDGRVNANFAVQLASGNNPPPTPTPTPGPTPTPTPPPPAADPVLNGLNPGTTGTNSISVTGAPPGSTVTFYSSSSTGSTRISSGVCAGETLDIRRASLIGTATANGSGVATRSVSISRRDEGRTFYFQATVESSTCFVTNRVSQTIGQPGGSPTPTPGPTPPPGPSPTPTPTPQPPPGGGWGGGRF